MNFLIVQQSVSVVLRVIEPMGLEQALLEVCQVIEVT